MISCNANDTFCCVLDLSSIECYEKENYSGKIQALPLAIVNRTF